MTRARAAAAPVRGPYDDPGVMSVSSTGTTNLCKLTQLHFSGTCDYETDAFDAAGNQLQASTGTSITSDDPGIVQVEPGLLDSGDSGTLVAQRRAARRSSSPRARSR